MINEYNSISEVPINEGVFRIGNRLYSGDVNGYRELLLGSPVAWPNVPFEVTISLPATEFTANSDGSSVMAKITSTSTKSLEKVEFSRDAFPPFATITLEPYEFDWCVTCFRPEEPLPRTTTLHAKATALDGSIATADLVVTVNAAPAAPPPPVIITDAQGFAGADETTGGLNGQHIVVTNFNNSGAGSLRQAVQYTTGPRIVTFTPGMTGTIPISSSHMYVDSGDLTIDGAGANITLTTYSINPWKSSGGPISNVIIKNLWFKDTAADKSAIYMIHGSKRMWIDHCTFTNNSLGEIGQPVSVWNNTGEDGLTGITVSWCRFNTPNKKALIVGSQEQTIKKQTRVSLHHNWFNGTEARNPRVHGGTLVHMWNNYIFDWGEYGMGASALADVLMQNNIFEASGDADAIITDYGGPSASSVNGTGNWFVGTPTPSMRSVGTFPMSSITYAAELEIANDALRQRIKAGAGANNALSPIIVDTPSITGKIYVIGDSTAASYESSRAPLTGWGVPFKAYYANKGVTVDNSSVSGSSTRDWVNSYWAPVLTLLNSGDYVFINLGANDAGTQGVPTSEYTSNLTQMINGAKSKGAIPVLLTPTTVRSFSGSTALATNTRLAPAMLALGASSNTATIDLDALSRALVQSYGVEGSKTLYLWTSPGQYPAYPNGVSDNVHFQVLGAQKMSDLVVNEIIRLQNAGAF